MLKLIHHSETRSEGWLKVNFIVSMVGHKGVWVSLLNGSFHDIAQLNQLETFTKYLKYLLQEVHIFFCKIVPTAPTWVNHIDNSA